MTKLFWKSLVVTPLILGAALVAGNASAQEVSTEDTLNQINQYNADIENLGQLRSVNQLSDVRPTDWAYQAVRSLVERYNCVAGYPDGTFRGSRAMTRYEAAALVNACMDTVNDLIAAATADLVTKEDLAVLQRLQEEFQAELATLRGRVDSLEARTAELEANQFSTTTKLQGEALFVLADAFDDDSSAAPGNTVFGGRVRLNLNTSFTGEDLLRTGLEAENIKDVTSLNGGLGVGGLEYASDSAVDGGTGSEVSVVLDSLWYQFPVGDKATVVVGPVGVDSSLFVPTTVWGGGFSTDNLDTTAIFEQDADEAGIGGNYQFNDTFNLAMGYTANILADDPSQGVFNDDYGAFAQLTATRGKFTGALNYGRQYVDGGADGWDGNLWDGVGTSTAADPFSTLASGSAASADTVGLILSYQFSPKFIIQGYGAHSWMNSETSSASARSLAAGLGFLFPDAFMEGNEAGVAVGLPPYVYDSKNGGSKDTETPFLVDMYYSWKVSDNISITPAVVLIFNGDGGTADSGDFEAVTAIKTRFTF
ncbi:MAG: iron uptake porin [Prochlorothrix sp.]